MKTHLYEQLVAALSEEISQIKYLQKEIENLQETAQALRAKAGDDDSLDGQIDEVDMELHILGDKLVQLYCGVYDAVDEAYADVSCQKTATQGETRFYELAGI